MANRLEENIEFLKRCITRENGHSGYIVDSLKYVIEKVEEQEKQIKVYEMQLSGALFNTNHEPTPKRTIRLKE